jgi:hypothetical protein
MGFHLRQNLFFCSCSGRTIFLDVNGDRYFCLVDRDDETFRRLKLGDDTSASHDRIEQLIRSRIIYEDPAPTSIADTTVLQPVREIEFRIYRPAVGEKAHAIRRQLSMALRLRYGGLASTFDHLRRKRDKLTLPESRDDNWPRVISSFASTTMLRPRSGHCLTSSLAMLSYAFELGLDADLVLGVRAAPFSAHCWLQEGDRIINDTLENVSRFIPIMTV